MSKTRKVREEEGWVKKEVLLVQHSRDRLRELSVYMATVAIMVQP